MARTRSGKVKAVETKSTSEAKGIKSNNTPGTQTPDIDEENGQALPPPTFNGALQKFQYKSVGVQTTSSDPASPAQSVKRVSKRTITQATDDDDDDVDFKVEATKSASKRSGKKRKSSRYADPSKYAHLKPLTDILEPNLICVFVGTNPGVQTATAGHAYAHPSNHFWKLLHTSGLTDRRLRPEEDVDLPRLYCMGNTNIVDRPSKDAAELSKEEMAAGTADLDAKFLKYKPEAICIVGKGIWEAIWRYRYGKNPKPSEFKYGWQDEKENMGQSKEEVLDDNGNVWRGARVFVTTSTSGLAASLKPAEKEAIWRPFGEWVQKKRAERAQATLE
ncbi:DNA glycosylase [Glonium stellatum]|uniref:DNA glycosylase n=1 Tax=Glonium stellatum TaxID=574774 RepID=A0A8E2F7Y4_9PEZI|nr:DNA glycosylase [Glonium stellatum]